MSAPLILGPLGELRNRSFAFYPAIVGIQHNQWTLRRATWTEVQVINTQTGAEVWVPRRLLAEVSSVEAPLLILGLVKELEYQEGAVVAHRRQVIEMPRAVNGGAHRLPAAPGAPTRPAPVVAIRTESSVESPARRWLRGGVAAGVLTLIAAGFVLRDFQWGGRSAFFRPGPRTLRLTAQDDYASVIQKLGPPYSDQWARTSSGAAYRRLWYGRRSLTVILTGDRSNSRYAGVLNGSGQILHTVAPALLEEISGSGPSLPVAPSR